jgi:hypothetical protein
MSVIGNAFFLAAGRPLNSGVQSILTTNLLCYLQRGKLACQSGENNTSRATEAAVVFCRKAIPK